MITAASAPVGTSDHRYRHRHKHQPAQTGTDRNQPAPTSTDQHRPALTRLDRHKTGTDRSGLFCDVFNKNIQISYLFERFNTK